MTYTVTANNTGVMRRANLNVAGKILTLYQNPQ